MSTTSLVRPFLKWPGGKFRIVPHLKSHLPNEGTLVEPFVGAGALFINTQYQQMVLNDINPDLINLYQHLQKMGASFIKEAKTLFTPQNNKQTTYYRIREAFNLNPNPLERALYFLYLNRHGYNGLCRYNLKGFYNVPFGNYCHPYFPEAELEHFYQKSQKALFYASDYVHLMKRYLKKPRLDKIIFYCDPPYAPLSKTANFTGYAAHRFTLEDQRQLAELARALARKGATVLISNHNTPFTRKIYQGCDLQCIEVSRTISCQGNSRKKVSEVIALF